MRGKCPNAREKSVAKSPEEMYIEEHTKTKSNYYDGSSDEEWQGHKNNHSNTIACMPPGIMNAVYHEDIRNAKCHH